ncbi:MAG: alpha/beta fold hydrolase [Deltaproteobacteria bacterium]|nr:MAG: alpha/beta fold hydrolase [Deltaproteobacteria bacterium]
MRLLPAFILMGCVNPEPIERDEDPAISAAPVGVVSIDLGPTTAEVWYPAGDEALDGHQDPLDVLRWVPVEVQELLGDDLDLADPLTGAYRDARIRQPERPYPVLIFSHGFGGMRLQSYDLTVHLASRGFVVIAPDHPGRNLSDQLPCLFSPPLPGCNLGIGGDDPAPAHVEAALDWIDDANLTGPFLAALDVDKIGMLGHSAGGGTTSRVGSDNERFSALLPMGGGAVIERDVPSLFMSATCDGIVPHSRVVEAESESVNSQLLSLRGGGHLAFSDLCELDLGTVADEILRPRDDVNSLILNQLTNLATDGCPGYIPDDPPDESCEDGFLDFELSHPILRHYATAFFEAELEGSGPGVQGGIFSQATLD